MKCIDLQGIHTKSLSIMDTKFAQYIYPTFWLKLNAPAKDTLLVKSGIKRKFRLLIHHMIGFEEYNSKWGYSIQKCPKNGYLQLYLSCFLIDALNVTLPLRQIQKIVGMSQICVIYVWTIPKKIWPLNCIIFASQNDKIVYNSNNILLIAFLSSLMGICFSCILYWPLSKIYNTQMHLKAKNYDSNKMNILYTINAGEIDNCYENCYENCPEYESIKYCYVDESTLGASEKAINVKRQ